jgi:thiosulfate/3-mercaptopyruvate sulfurtransferase
LIRIKDEPGVVLLDSRPPSAYTGKGPWMRPGHIPGAVNIPAQYLMDEHNTALLKSPVLVRQVFSSRGITPDQMVICSCGTGRVATMVFLVLKYLLGYPNVFMFEGGFTEWVSYPGNPVVTGHAPR